MTRWLFLNTGTWYMEAPLTQSVACEKSTSDCGHFSATSRWLIRCDLCQGALQRLKGQRTHHLLCNNIKDCEQNVCMWWPCHLRSCQKSVLQGQDRGAFMCTCCECVFMSVCAVFNRTPCVYTVSVSWLTSLDPSRCCSAIKSRGCNEVFLCHIPLKSMLHPKQFHFTSC